MSSAAPSKVAAGTFCANARHNAIQGVPWSLAQMRHTFNSCSALETIDLRRFKASALADLTYTFGACAKLRAVLVGPN